MIERAELPISVKRDYHAVSFALLSAVVGVIIMRLIVYYLPIDSSTYGGTLAVNAIFACITQLGFFLAVPFCIYRFYGKKSFAEVRQFSSIGGFKPCHLFAVPLGFCVFFLTIGISSVWTALLRLTGYTVTSSTPLPETFNGGYLVADLLLTAVLPAVCEEFVMRGGTVTVAKQTFGTVGCVVFGGIAFGLFHQNIRQVFYTALFGALAVFLVIKLKSIFPAVLLHFTNNFLSVYLDYASTYKWAVGGAFYDFLGSFDLSRAWALMLIGLAVAVTGVGLVILMLYFKERRVMRGKLDAIKDAAFDATNKRVVLFGEYDPQKIEGLEMEREVYGSDYAPRKYRPSIRDIAVTLGAGVTALLTTVFTYVWGFLY